MMSLTLVPPPYCGFPRQLAAHHLLSGNSSALHRYKTHYEKPPHYMSKHPVKLQEIIHAAKI
jgi:hypothetical protein